MFRFDPRFWQVLEMRVDKSMTLAEIGCHFGVTRERVRQIERRAWNQFLNHSKLVTPVLDFVEKNVSVISRCDRKELISHVLEILPQGQFGGSELEVGYLVLLVRALAFLDPNIDKAGMIEKRWPRFSYMACKLDPVVSRHLRAYKYSIKEKEGKRRLSYKEIAFKILEDEGKPLHWKEISDRAYHFGHRQSFNSTAVYNCLLNHPQLFVRVNAGTYALSEWGVDEVAYYQDIIALVLREEGKALPYESIYHRVTEKRQIKRTTLIMLLDMYPRFYRSLENTYGLRGWLAPREKQTLRTPEWLVESLDSYERLEQAANRGYNVESILQQDLENN
jgi:hypothetical protein